MAYFYHLRSEPSLESSSASSQALSALPLSEVHGSARGRADGKAESVAGFWLDKGKARKNEEQWPLNTQSREMKPPHFGSRLAIPIAPTKLRDLLHTKVLEKPSL